MADTTVKVDSETRDRLAAVAAAHGKSVRAFLSDVAVQEENHLKLAEATAVFREVTRRPGVAEAFDAAFPEDAAPTSPDFAERAA
ncbi:antitoxin MazE7 [Streptomyces sp. NPDC050204]|uniref:antitoxin MazE7 n=1 Tax=Streptomyces sp. NPDC050204 TaxID=3155514 RepID=UPI0034160404